MVNCSFSVMEFVSLSFLSSKNGKKKNPISCGMHLATEIHIIKKKKNTQSHWNIYVYERYETLLNNN